MASTTNYSWSTPDDTALVKDGAAAIRSLGSSIDTTTKALNPSTTLGDIEYRSATANTNTRLGIGTSGQVLTVAGGVPSWATASGGAYTTLATGSLSGASVTLSSISTSYKTLWLRLNDVYMASTNGAPRMTLNNNTGSAYLTSSTFLGTNPSTTFDDSYINVISTLSNVNTTNTIDVYFYNYSIASSYKYLAVSGIRETTTNNNFVFAPLTGFFSDDTAAITRIDLSAFLNNGTSSTFSGGTYTLYGGN
jgi:hypothetical protein